jgi:hypothetical protein
MSTSPSWFDQEKFSRLVKKVGPKTAPEPVAAQPSVETEGHPESLASTARISLVSKPPSLLSEHRALPTLPRRTAPLPGLKALFQPPPKTEQPAPQAPSEESASPAAEVKPPTTSLPKIELPKYEPKIELPKVEPKPEETKNDVPEIKNEATIEGIKSPSDEESHVTEESEEGGDDLEGIWHKMALLNEELAQTIQERDQAVSDSNILREQLQKSDDALTGNQSDATKEEFARLIRERDEALAEAQSLRQKATPTPSAPPSFGRPAEDISKTKELSMLASERDQARKQYAELRKQFESMKQEQATGSIPNPKEESSKFRKELEQQVEGFRQKLEERNREIAALKAGGAVATSGSNAGGEDATAIREQLTKAKEEASVAQRGLALSQKALHETRDTLREATEGSSLSRHNFDNLKTECATLSQQNTVLQAQNDQLSRELAAAKSKLTTRT